MPLPSVPESPRPPSEAPSAEHFAEALRARPLPESLTGSSDRLQRFQGALLSCVESLYCDRIAPSLGEVAGRLRSAWPSQEVQAALLVCAREPETYAVLPPANGAAPQVLLRNPPPCFQGWVDMEAADAYPAAVWQELAQHLSDPETEMTGGVCKHALALRRCPSLPLLRQLSLGELRHILHLALGPDKALLAYDAWHGGRLRPCGGCAKAPAPADGPKRPGAPLRAPTPAKAGIRPAPGLDIGRPAGDAAAGVEVQPLVPTEAAQASELALEPTASGRLTEALRARGLAERLPHGGDEAELRRRSQTIQSCVESLYRDCLEPTLGEVQQRLRECGWSTSEAQMAPFLCARAPEIFEIAEPEDGEPMRILLRKPPQWFGGWVAGGVAGPTGKKTYPPLVWEALAGFLRADSSIVLKGGINGAAQALRARALPQLGRLNLGELRELLRQAVSERGLLRYSGNDLRPRQEALQLGPAEARLECAGDVPRGKKIYSQI